MRVFDFGVLDSSTDWFFEDSELHFNVLVNKYGIKFFSKLV
jgi:hypothetical protein